MLRAATIPLLLAAVTAGASPRIDTVTIAPPNVALTFARVVRDGAPRALAVVRYEAGAVTGVDLGTLFGRTVPDPIALLNELSYDALRDRIAGAPDSARVVETATDLVVPVDLTGHHVAAGTNYPEHAGEAQVEDGPFLFAKLVQPTGPRAAVPLGDALLDYEVELAWVALDPLAPGERPARMGLVLCNDYTDRATLLRLVDVWDPTSGKGFTTGKSAPGYLPVGDLFVVPRDVRRFAADLELRLWVNGTLRQRARVSEQIWDLDEMLAETWARRDVTWDHRGGRAALIPPPGGTIPPRTLLMSGTPGGTVFAGIDVRTRAAGVGAWLAGGWGVPVTAQVVEAYVRRARDARIYLQAGDRVTIHVDRLGVVENAIEEDA
jgi:2,4-didehydro-3-deoxy-L-rhamnonate hydrolase